MLGILLLLPSIVFSKSSDDMGILLKLFDYASKVQEDSIGIKHTAYFKYNFITKRRNPTLYMVPTMYKLAHGERNYVGETYGFFRREKDGKYRMYKQVMAGTISNYRKAMPTVVDLMMPHIYSISLYDNHILSPFNLENSKFYKYETKRRDAHSWTIEFKPKIANTQLIKGNAILDDATARVQYIYFRGEYDMIHFTVGLDMGKNAEGAQLPVVSHVSANLRFLGNHTSAEFLAHINLPQVLADTTTEHWSLEQMELLRPCPLTKWEEKIYQEYYEPIDTTRNICSTDSTRDSSAIQKPSAFINKYKRIKDVTWTAFDDYVWSSLRTQLAHGEIKLSPIVNPVSLSYSPSRGLAYKMKLYGDYHFTENTLIETTPYIGYNIKIKQFFYEVPLKYPCNMKQDGWIQFKFSNGNRISNSTIFESIKDQRRDTINFSQLNLTYIDDKELRLEANMELTPLVDVRLGMVYHDRKPVKKQDFEVMGIPPHFKSFAPTVYLRLRPYIGGPILSINYERGIKGLDHANTEYERWEFDTSYKKEMTQQRFFNLKVGGGLYTNKSSTYFVDFENFHQNYLSEGWNDDWTGDFQLLNSNWYNASKYYIRSNVSYESPLMIISTLPWIGKIIESERIYGGLLLIEHSEPYSEIGYGFTNRYFSMAGFVSFLNTEIYNTGIKFSFELFRKW